MNLFYLPSLTESSSIGNFDKDESRHLIKVLRKKQGDSIYITNGKGLLFEAVITDENPKGSEFKIINTSHKEKLPYRLHLAVAPTKMNDRYEWFLEKATEIGVSEITPLFCDNSERKTIKPERLHRILESAMKQSLSCFMPILNDAISFSNFIEDLDFNIHHKFIAHCEKGEKKLLKECVGKKQDVLILIGPEGDFSSSEIEKALQKGFHPLHLSTSRLRTETAAILACSSISEINL